ILHSTGYAKYVDLGYGGFAHLINKNLLYSSQHLQFNHHDLESISDSYKQAIKNKSTFFYQDSNWLSTSLSHVTFEDYKNDVINNIQNSQKIKNKINSIYENMLPKKIQFAAKFQQWRFNITVPQKEVLLKEIFKNGLFASSHYASLDGIFSTNKAPNAEKIHSSIINLFNDRYFNESKAVQLCKIINKHLQLCE
ncbi:MAG: hypothetical protein WCP97_02245, partial [bacterium]